MPVEEGNSQSASPVASPRTSDVAEEVEEEPPIELKVRGLSDGFLQVATEIEQIVEENVIDEPAPTLIKRILKCLANVIKAFKK
jgi:hypothetical protein